jgi:hypothetical protein
MDADADGRWMTYTEIAEARGIDRQSARRLANRAGWRRQKDNHGVVRVYVPLGRDTPHRKERDTPAGVPAVLSADAPAATSADISHAIRGLEAAVTSLTARAESAEKRAEQAEIRAERMESRAFRAEQAFTDERSRANRAESRADQAELAADKLESQLDVANAAAAAAQEMVEELRQAETRPGRRGDAGHGYGRHGGASDGARYPAKHRPGRLRDSRCGLGDGAVSARVGPGAGAVWEPGGPAVAHRASANRAGYPRAGTHCSGTGAFGWISRAGALGAAALGDVGGEIMVSKRLRLIRRGSPMLDGDISRKRVFPKIGG